MSPSTPALPAPPPGKVGWPWTTGSASSPVAPPGGTWPRISIVTPSYEQGHFLEETIRSVLLQGYPNLEYIVMDGGSTDGSVEVIERYEPWISHWTSEPDRGQSDAIRKGFERSSGDILGWLNSDDRFRSGALLAAAATYRRHPDAALVYGRSAVCDETGTATGETVGREFSLTETVQGDNCVAQPSAFFARAAYESVGGIDASLHYVMDMDLWLKIGLRGRVVFIDDLWADFRYHSGSKTCQGTLEFDREIHDIVRRAFRSLPLPGRLASRERSIVAELLMRLAYRYYQLAESGQARRHALRSVARDPRLLRDRTHRGTFLRCLVGRRGVLQLKEILGRPANG